MLCRLCLEENIKDVVSCSEFPELVEIVKSALDVKMDEDNEYPRTVCVTCYDKTMEYYAFRTRCLENQKTLRIRQIRQKVAEKIKSENDEDDNDVVFVCETREEPTKETPGMSEKQLKTYPATKKPLKREITPKKTFEQEMKKHKVSPCSVHVERLTQKDILQHLRQQMYRKSKSLSYTKKYNSLAYVNDHSYYSTVGQPTKSATAEHKSDIQVMRTYCRPNGEVMGEQSQPPADPSPDTTPQPRIKVLSSAEINSRASQPTRKTLSCTLINNRGRLEFSFTDAEANKIDFWTMSERQKRDVLDTLRPEKISQQLKLSFSMIPITRDTEAKLLSLYHGKIPFTVIVKD